MRVAGALMVAAMVVAGPATAWAQVDESRFMLSLNGAFEPGDETFTDDGTFTLYDEAGRLTVSSRSSTGAILDLGVGARVVGNFTLGVSAHRGASSDEATVIGQAPHPIFFNRPRSFSVTVAETKRIEQALHFSAGFLVPLGERFDVHLYGGPSQFRFSQQVIGEVVIQEANAAATAVTATPEIVARKKNSWGGHVAADFSYKVAQIGNGSFRLGAFVRYAQASSEFPVLSSTVSTKIGGMQYGGGLRVRF
ncbi:MAG: hypothetical protein AB7U83_09550 [Vicinamibacterales bacterium]